MTLVFPDPPMPDVSVIVIVHNAWDWTVRALEALRDRTPPVYQLIVVDNASTDGAAEGLAELHGATVLRNAHNVGFGPAANQAAVFAAGRHLVLLNSDALVHDDWLAPLLEIADAEDDVGAVGGRLLNLDGTLQEAGSLVWRDGRVSNYGDGDDPNRPEYSFRRDVDYVSAALLLIRRAAFTALGGFDPAYAPAYFEDVDLCYGLGARGMRVVYQPRATATHVRWASGDQSHTKELVARNLPLFQQRWADVLNDRLAYPGIEDRRLFLACRDDQCSSRLMLVASAIDASTTATLSALQTTHPKARLTLVTPDRNDSAARAQGVEVITLDDDWQAALDDRRLLYDTVLAGDDMAERAREIVASTQPHLRPVIVRRTQD